MVSSQSTVRGHGESESESARAREERGDGGIGVVRAAILMYVHVIPRCSTHELTPPPLGRPAPTHTEPMVDIAYGGGTQEAMSQERVMCKPMDFACFFGVSGWG